MNHLTSLQFLLLVRWVVGCVLAFYALAGGLVTLGAALEWWLRKRSSSGLPFVCAVLGPLAMLVLPVPSLCRWCWIPIVADISVPACLYYYSGRFFRAGKARKEEATDEVAG